LAALDCFAQSSTRRSEVVGCLVDPEPALLRSRDLGLHELGNPRSNRVKE
jgi:hypothetical protein